jgi:signal transduction histidine kinase
MAEGERPLSADELKTMVLRLARLVEISVTLNSTLELDRLLQMIINSAADLVDSEAASILLVAEHTHDLYFAAATGADPAELARIPVPLEGSIAGTIYREGEPVILNQVAHDPRHFREVGEKVNLETRSLMGVPMRIRDKITGVLEAINKRRGEFDAADVEILKIIASQAAVAIHNARLLNALQRAYDELGKLDKLKSDFISIASHELRTPLGVILGYAAILKEDVSDPATAEHAAAVVHSAMRMRDLIEDMTNVNLLRTEAPEVSLERQPLQPIVQDAYNEVADLVHAKGQAYHLRLPPEPLAARVDRGKLSMALTNLLNNAMRFTPAAGRIAVELAQRGSEAWIRVSDNGPGIPPDKLEQIFEPFVQVEDHMTRRHQGMGLGLTIAKAIVGAHGGRIWAESDGPGRGAVFTVAVPLGSG